PTFSTIPAPSCPRTAGKGIGMSPARVMESVWHTPEATIRTSASPRPGSPRSISCSVNGASFSSTTSARIRIVPTSSRSSGTADSDDHAASGAHGITPGERSGATWRSCGSERADGDLASHIYLSPPAVPEHLRCSAPPMRSGDRCRHRLLHGVARLVRADGNPERRREPVPGVDRRDGERQRDEPGLDRKSTRLNSSHVKISYAVFCLKKK